MTAIKVSHQFQT